MLGKLQTYKLQPTKFYEKGHWLQTHQEGFPAAATAAGLRQAVQPPAVSSVAGRHQGLVIRRRVHRVTLLQTLPVSAGRSEGSEGVRAGQRGVRAGQSGSEGSERGLSGVRAGSERGQRGVRGGQRRVRAGSEGSQRGSEGG